jgi:hypothetical protein
MFKDYLHYDMMEFITLLIDNKGITKRVFEFCAIIDRFGKIKDWS